MGLGDTLKQLVQKLSGRVAQTGDETPRDDTDSAAAPGVNRPPDPVSAAAADTAAAGFPEELE
jgi:hypothetical protein